MATADSGSSSAGPSDAERRGDPPAPPPMPKRLKVEEDMKKKMRPLHGPEVSYEEYLEFRAQGDSLVPPREPLRTPVHLLQRYVDQVEATGGYDVDPLPDTGSYWPIFITPLPEMVHMFPEYANLANVVIEHIKMAEGTSLTLHKIIKINQEQCGAYVYTYMTLEAIDGVDGKLIRYQAKIEGRPAAQPEVVDFRKASSNNK